MTKKLKQFIKEATGGRVATAKDSVAHPALHKTLLKHGFQEHNSDYDGGHITNYIHSGTTGDSVHKALTKHGYKPDGAGETDDIGMHHTEYKHKNGLNFATVSRDKEGGPVKHVSAREHNDDDYDDDD